jgi:rfaE bifunctional protein nucleotidyltransferase chain/domain
MKNPLAHPKVVSLDALLQAITPLREHGKTLVFTNGCFDILHPGHVDLLARAKKEGDILVLGLNSDASVRRQGKGNDRPFNTFAARAFVLAHLESVDYAVEFDDDTPKALIDAIFPDVLVKGGDWPVEKIVGNDTVMAKGGKVLSLPLLDGYSTTNLAEKIRFRGMSEM